MLQKNVHCDSPNATNGDTRKKIMVEIYASSKCFGNTPIRPTYTHCHYSQPNQNPDCLRPCLHMEMMMNTYRWSEQQNKCHRNTQKEKYNDRLLSKIYAAAPVSCVIARGYCHLLLSLMRFVHLFRNEHHRRGCSQDFFPHIGRPNSATATANTHPRRTTTYICIDIFVA